MNSGNKEISFLDFIFNILRENHEFCKTNPIGKEVHDELIELMNDAVDHLLKLNDPVTTKRPFVVNGLVPYSYGIYMSFLSGNIVTCFMQLRLLIEYLALTVISDNLPGNNMITKVATTREKFNRVSHTEMIRNFDSNAYELWRLLSEWLHAKSYSKKIEDMIIKDDMKTWSTLQPAPYDQDDEEHLKELLRYIQSFRDMLKRKLAVN